MPRPLAAIFTRLPFVFPPALWLAGTAAKRRLIQDQKRREKMSASQRKHLKQTDFCEMPLTHRGAGRLRAQLRGVTVERCSVHGIGAWNRGSVELTGCSLRGNGTDYYVCSSGGTITADGKRQW